MVLYICKKFRHYISNCFQLTEQTRVYGRNAMFTVQRPITIKVSKPGLQFMCSVHHLIVLYICVKFHENISDGISYGADTNDGNADGQTDGRTDRHSKFQRI